LNDKQGAALHCLTVSCSLTVVECRELRWLSTDLKLPTVMGGRIVGARRFLAVLRPDNARPDDYVFTNATGRRPTVRAIEKAIKKHHDARFARIAEDSRLTPTTISNATSGEHSNVLDVADRARAKDKVDRIIAPVKSSDDAKDPAANKRAYATAAKYEDLLEAARVARARGVVSNPGAGASSASMVRVRSSVVRVKLNGGTSVAFANPALALEYITAEIKRLRAFLVGADASRVAGLLVMPHASDPDDHERMRAMITTRITSLEDEADNIRQRDVLDRIAGMRTRQYGEEYSAAKQTEFLKCFLPRKDRRDVHEEWWSPADDVFTDLPLPLDRKVSNAPNASTFLDLQCGYTAAGEEVDDTEADDEDEDVLDYPEPDDGAVAHWFTGDEDDLNQIENDHGEVDGTGDDEDLEDTDPWTDRLCGEGYVTEFAVGKPRLPAASVLGQIPARRETVPVSWVREWIRLSRSRPQPWYPRGSRSRWAGRNIFHVVPSGDGFNDPIPVVVDGRIVLVQDTIKGKEIGPHVPDPWGSNSSTRLISRTKPATDQVPAKKKPKEKPWCWPPAPTGPPDSPQAKELTALLTSRKLKPRGLPRPDTPSGKPNIAMSALVDPGPWLEPATVYAMPRSGPPRRRDSRPCETREDRRSRMMTSPTTKEWVRSSWKYGTSEPARGGKRTRVGKKTTWEHTPYASPETVRYIVVSDELGMAA
jgi:hypothetical protein